jgi:hypothetical protein
MQPARPCKQLMLSRQIGWLVGPPEVEHSKQFEVELLKLSVEFRASSRRLRQG